MNWSIITHFARVNRYGFTFQDVAKEFPEKNRVYLARILADMVKIGMLCKVSRDIYHIIPPQADPESYVPDAHQVAKYIMQDKEYYIGYASALKIHGLTNLPEARELEVREYVVTRKQTKPAVRSFWGVNYHFIKHSTSRFFGFNNIWINQLEKAMVSDLEKTIVDMATKPQFCGGIVEVGKALLLARDRTDHDKLFYYFARNMNKSAKKRFLFLTELLDLEWTSEHDRMMKELGSGISLLDRGLEDQGRRRSKFGLKINMDPINIKKKILHRNGGPPEDIKGRNL